VFHSRDDKGLGADHKVNSPKINFLDDNGAVLIKFKQAFRMPLTNCYRILKIIC